MSSCRQLVCTAALLWCVSTLFPIAAPVMPPERVIAPMGIADVALAAPYVRFTRWPHP